MIFIKTEYSLLESACKLEKAIEKCVKLNIKEVAVVDSNLFGVVKFYELCKKNNIKPNIGCELNIDGEKKIAICKNNTGYQNLIKLISLDYISHTIFQKSNFGLIIANVPVCLCIEEEDTYLIDVLECMKDGIRFDDKITRKDIHIDKIRDIPFENCDVTLNFGNYHLPKFPHEGDNTTYFKKLCKNGMLKRYGSKPTESQIKRLMYEISVIEKMGFIDYFLIVWDYVKYARENKIPVGVGRGSGAGSICAYCLGITGIDPLKYGLIFERFLNPERISMPDFDIDFCINGRQQVIDYVIKKYGSERTAQILALSTMSAKTLRRDLANIGMNMFESEKVIEKLDGFPRHISVHAAGVAITDNPTTDYIPTILHNDTRLTQFDMIDLEKCGLVKMDILGLRNLTLINECALKVGCDINNVPLDDKAVYAMLSKGNTQAVFQLESDGVTKLLMKMQPTSLEDIIACISLYRPGPMDSIPIYLQNRKNPKLIRYKHPLLEPILKETFGCVVYQEQVMEIFRVLAGYSYGGADLVRRAMAKRKKDILSKEKERFIYGCKLNNISETVSVPLFDELEKFSSYAFNKSHATCYAFIAYQTAYLKYYYRKEFLATDEFSGLSDIGNEGQIFIG
ncbi:MAG: PHP domain-containing protein [Oscillospiraceae bacterium]|jgi:DNA polymerase-3 subunit alpha|nr:PHP domain-containing protein [Oscillospiraceae bacterium]